MKNAKVSRWELAHGLYRYMTQNLKTVIIAVDWTDDGYFKVLEACVVIDGRGIPFYSIAMHRDELAGRQTTLERTMWYALCAMRLDGQTLRVVVDRGFAKFDFIGKSPLYPYLHWVLRLKGAMILTWGTIRGPLKEWPLYKGEVVPIEQAYLGKESHKSSRPCAWRTCTTKPIPSGCSSYNCQEKLRYSTPDRGNNQLPLS